VPLKPVRPLLIVPGCSSSNWNTKRLHSFKFCFKFNLQPRCPPGCLSHDVALSLNSVSGLVSKIWHRILFDQSELSIYKIPPTDSPTVRPGRDS